MKSLFEQIENHWYLMLVESLFYFLEMAHFKLSVEDSDQPFVNCSISSDWNSIDQYCSMLAAGGAKFERSNGFIFLSFVHDTFGVFSSIFPDGR